MTDQTAQRQQVIDDLLVLIRASAADNLLVEIATGDSQALPGDDKTHLAALHALRDSYDWRLFRQPDNSWYPCEPIELITYAVDSHSRAAQVFCNALLALSELDGTEQDYMAYRWFHTPGEAWFRALPAPWGPALLAAYAVHHAESHALEREFWGAADAKGAWIEPQGGWHD
ncbi:MAG: hypothetical protein AAFQ19_15560 [Pseudomonadota bacterium]